MQPLLAAQTHALQQGVGPLLTNLLALSTQQQQQQQHLLLLAAPRGSLQQLQQQQLAPLLQQLAAPWQDLQLWKQHKAVKTGLPVHQPRKRSARGSARRRWRQPLQLLEVSWLLLTTATAAVTARRVMGLLTVPWMRLCQRTRTSAPAAQQQQQHD